MNLPSIAEQRMRRFAWVGIGFAVLGVGVTAVERSKGAHIPWTSWALPVLLIANACVFVLPAARRHQRATIVYNVFSTVAALIVLGAILLRIRNP